MPRESGKTTRVSKSSRKVSTKEAARTRPAPGLAVSLQSISDLIAAHSEVDSMSQPRTFDEAHEWLKIHNAWIEKVSHIVAEIMKAVSVARKSRKRQDSRELLEYVERLAELARAAAKAQQSTETLTRCFVQQ